jgi:hypothetical protein
MVCTLLIPDDQAVVVLYQKWGLEIHPYTANVENKVSS